MFEGENFNKLHGDFIIGTSDPLNSRRPTTQVTVTTPMALRSPFIYESFVGEKL